MIKPVQRNDFTNFCTLIPGLGFLAGIAIIFSNTMKKLFSDEKSELNSLNNSQKNINKRIDKHKKKTVTLRWDINIVVNREKKNSPEK